MASVFLYSPLQPEQKHIRLVTIHASPMLSQPIRCSLSTYPIQEAPEYNALSYCWGETQEHQPIFLDEKHFLVTKNLFEALLHLRQPDRPTIVWIDAICINQSDAKEKSHQIPLMGQIYSRSNKVVAWLGTESDNCKMAFQLINEWANIWLMHTTKFENEKTAFLNRDLKPLWSKISKSFHAPSWHAAQKIFQRPYWTRLWVTQEVVLASNTVLQCGQASLALSSLFNFGLLALLVCEAPNVRNLTPFQLRLFNNCNYPESGHLSILVGARQRRCSERFNIFTLLNLTRRLRCKDPRDKIYAILGLAALGPSPERWLIVPDYEKDIDQVRLDFTVSCIQATNSLNIFSMCGFGVRSSPACQSLPSWVLDFERLDSVTSADGKFEAIVQNDIFFSWSSDHHFLSTQGVIFAKVMRTAGYCEDLREILAKWFVFIHDCDVQSPMRSPKLLSLFQTVQSNYTTSLKRMPIFKTAMDREIFYTEAAGFCFLMASIICNDQRNTSHIKEFEQLISELGIWTAHLEVSHPESSPAILVSSIFRYSSIEDIFSNGMRIMEGLVFKLDDKLSDKELFIAENGFMGLALRNTVRVGDQVCLLRGCRSPLLIRDGTSHHILVSDCYINDIVYGEILDGADKRSQTKTIVLQ
jgi:hypothetical protein